MGFVNLTPHTINIVTESGDPIKTIPSSGTIARVSVLPTSDIGEIEGVPSVVDGGYGAVEGLPEHQSGVYLIVSGLLRSKVMDRNDVCSPGKLIRDSGGKPVGALGLVFNKNPRTAGVRPMDKRLVTNKISSWFKVSSYLVPRYKKEKARAVLEIRASVRNPKTGNWCERTISRIGFNSKKAAIREAKALRTEARRTRVRTASRSRAKTGRVRYILKAAYGSLPVSILGGAANRGSSTRNRVASLYRANLRVLGQAPNVRFSPGKLVSQEGLESSLEKAVASGSLSSGELDYIKFVLRRPGVIQQLKEHIKEQGPSQTFMYRPEASAFGPKDVDKGKRVQITPEKLQTDLKASLADGSLTKEEFGFLLSVLPRPQSKTAENQKPNTLKFTSGPDGTLYWSYVAEDQALDSGTARSMDDLRALMRLYPTAKFTGIQPRHERALPEKSSGGLARDTDSPSRYNPDAERIDSDLSPGGEFMR